MAPVTMPPTEEARDVFRRLGYVIDGDGTQFRAERKWRTVHVTTLCADDAVAPVGVVDDGGGDDEFRCFVTWKTCTAELAEHLRVRKPAYEWAVIGVDGSKDFEVVRDIDEDLVPA